MIGVVGRLDIAQKGQDVMIRALPAVRERMPGVALLLVGDGPDRARPRSLANQLGLGDAVRFAGYRNDIPDVLAAVDSLWHPFGLRGRVGFRRDRSGRGRASRRCVKGGGLPEVVFHNESGLIVRKVTSTAFDRTIARIIVRSRAGPTTRYEWPDAAMPLHSPGARRAADGDL